MTKYVKNDIESNLSKNKFIIFLTLTCLFFSFNMVKISYGISAEAIKFPSRPIKFIIPSSAGGTNDRETRMIAPFLEKYLGVSIQIENIAGADGIIAFNRFYKEKPDGYTLLTFNIISPIVLELTRKTEYITKEFSFIGAWRVNNFVLDCHPDNWKNFTEFLNDAKKKEISMAAMGGAANLQGRLLENAMGINFNWVPYKSGQEGIAAVAGKHVDSVITFTVTTMPMVRAGKLNALLVFTPKRDNFLPGVPTPKELGHNNIPCLLTRGGMAAPPKTPREIVTKLEQTFKKITEDPEFMKMAEKIGVAVDFQTSSEISKSIPDLYELIAKYKDVF